MLRWHEIPAGQELEEPVGLLGGLEPPHRRRRLSKGRHLCGTRANKGDQFPPLAGTGGGFFWMSEREKKFASPRKRGTSLLLRVEVQTRQAWSIVSTARRQRVRQHIGAPYKARLVYSKVASADLQCAAPLACRQ